MAVTQKKYSDREVRIRRVSDPVRRALRNISRNSGISMTDLLKPKLLEVVNSYPDWMREEKPSV